MSKYSLMKRKQNISTYRVRMTADERREAIILASIPVFARHGFVGTTTKELSEAAEVSEALLYQHFPSKESLYEKIQEKICSTESTIHNYIYDLPVCSESVVKIVYLIFRLFWSKSEEPYNDAVCRLMVQSYLEDGYFVKSFNLPRFNKMLLYMEKFADASIEAGDMSRSPLSHNERLWFSHHLAFFLKLSHLTENRIFEYGSSKSETLFNAVWFTLRGIGFKDEVIRRYLNVEILDLEIDNILEGIGM